VTACGATAQRVWVLDADLTAAFDKIDHDHLLATIGDFPGRTQIRGWLKAGVFEKGKGFAPTDAGTPQGGLCSAEHKEPNEQCWVMRSAGLSGLVRA
jgi:RNA-directed DNA polymerase